MTAREYPWEWGIAGAVVSPAVLLLSGAGDERFIGLVGAVLAAGVIFAGSVTAVRRHETWQYAALNWGCVALTGFLVYLAWGNYSEPLAKPGDLNVITLNGATTGGRVRFRPELLHELRRGAVAFVASAVLAGALEVWRRGGPWRRRPIGGVLLAVAWAVCLPLAAVLAIGSAYAADALSNAMASDIEVLTLGAGFIVGGLAGGLLMGFAIEVTQRLALDA